MTEQDTTVDDVDTDVYTEIDTPDAPELTVDDYNLEKSRREKAERTLVEQKRKIKELEAKTSDKTGYVTKEDLAIERFLDKNSDLTEYADDIRKYTKTGLSLEEAKTLVVNSDKAKANREKTNSLGL